MQAEIERAVTSPVRLLHDMLAFQMDSDPSPEGNVPELVRPRGTLCLLVCATLSGDHRAALPAAAAVELAHHQFVAHRGIDVTGNQIVGDETRIEGRWGSGQAINAGDGLHALARISLMRLSDHGCDDDIVLTALRTLDDGCARTCEGLHLELLAKEGAQTTAAYVGTASLKTGALMGCAAQLGALIAGKGVDVQQSFQMFGGDLGVALQIREDIGARKGDQTALEQVARHKVSQAMDRISLLGISASDLAEFQRLGEVLLSYGMPDAQPARPTAAEERLG